MAIGDVLQGGSINLASFSSFLPTIYFWLKIFGSALVVVGVGVGVYFLFFRYPIRVTLIKSVGRGYKILRDSARVSTGSDGIRTLTLMRWRNGSERITAPVPPGSMKTLSGSRDHFFFYLDDNGQLQTVPFRMDENDPNLRLVSEDRKGFVRNMYKRAAEKYKQQQLWQQLAPYAVLGVTLMIVFLICYFAFSEIGNGFEKVARLLADLISILQRTVA